MPKIRILKIAESNYQVLVLKDERNLDSWLVPPATCESEEQARVYARGLDDGWRAFLNNSESLTRWATVEEFKAPAPPKAMGVHIRKLTRDWSVYRVNDDGSELPLAKVKTKVEAETVMARFRKSLGVQQQAEA